MNPKTPDAVRALGPRFSSRLAVPSDSDAQPDDAELAVVWTGSLWDLTPNPHTRQARHRPGPAQTLWRTIALAKHAVGPGSLVTLSCAVIALTVFSRLMAHWQGYNDPQRGVWRVFSAAQRDLFG